MTKTYKDWNITPELGYIRIQSDRYGTSATFPNEVVALAWIDATFPG